MKKEKISIVTIVKDEEKMIDDCLKSSIWADELVLIDTGSTDQTIKIAQGYGAKIAYVKTEERNWGAWHNRGIKEASGDWIFYLDADERITPELQKEIIEVISQKKDTAFAIPRRNVLLGKPMYYGGWYPDYQIRLFRKDKLIKWEGKLHERPIFKGELGHLKQPMIHLTHRDLTSMMEKTRKWAAIEADLLLAAKHPPIVWWRLLKVMFDEFILRFIKKQAWRDGKVGWIEGIFQMFSRFLTYAYLWEKQQEEK